MSEERTNALGRVAANEELMYALKVGIDTDRAAARAVLDPYKEVDEINTDSLPVIIDRINNQVRQYKKLKAQTATIKADFGFR